MAFVYNIQGEAKGPGELWLMTWTLCEGMEIDRFALYKLGPERLETKQAFKMEYAFDLWRISPQSAIYSSLLAICTADDDVEDTTVWFEPVITKTNMIFQDQNKAAHHLSD